MAWHVTWHSVLTFVLTLMLAGVAATLCTALLWPLLTLPLQLVGRGRRGQPPRSFWLQWYLDPPSNPPVPK